MKNKVAHITTVHSANDIRIYHKECKSLQEAGYEVWLITQAQENVEHSKVKYIFLPSFKGRLKRMFFLPFKAFVEAVKLKADLYHFHDPELIPIGLLLKLCGKKVIYDAHEDISAQVFNKVWIRKEFKNIISISIRLFEGLAVRCFNAVVTATPKIRDNFKNKLKLTVDINNFPLLNESIISENEKRYIVYAGGISVLRGSNEILEVAGKISTKLVLCGPVSPCVDKEKLIKHPNIDYQGVLSRQEMTKLISNAAAGLVLFHPVDNHIEAMPNKMFEYMQQGIPVIGSNFPMWKEILEKYDCGLCVDPLNVNEICAAIGKIINNPVAAQKMGQNGVELVKSKLNWKSESKKLINLYQEILGN